MLLRHPVYLAFDGIFANSYDRRGRRFSLIVSCSNGTIPPTGLGSKLTMRI
jgi:hypothetical protein